MRFSLKWLLAGTAYIAVAAASFTFGERTWVYGEILHGMTMAAFVYADKFGSSQTRCGSPFSS
jgi:hypothetical protein